MTISTEDALKSLRSMVCPACKLRKVEKQSLCYRCYKRLPSGCKKSLYKPLMGGYEEALDFSLECLGITVPYMPGD